MLPLDEFLDRARALSRQAFIDHYPGHFLLKRPSRTAGRGPTPSGFDFATVAAKIDADPFAHEWRIVPVIKRPGNPFPERLTVGRATNCDVVLRVPFVSKVHAHILKEEDGSFCLHDNRAANATFHNHRKLEPGSTRNVATGDSLGFGSLEFELVDAARLYDVLRSEVRI